MRPPPSAGVVNNIPWTVLWTLDNTLDNVLDNTLDNTPDNNLQTYGQYQSALGRLVNNYCSDNTLRLERMQSDSTFQAMLLQFRNNIRMYSPCLLESS